MFRKLANIFVLLLFIVSTTGFTISKHYCKGNLVSVSVITAASSCCDMSNCNCCHNEDEFLQLKNDFTATSYTIDNSIIYIELSSMNLDINQIDGLTKELNFSYPANGPPFNDRQFLYYIHQLKLAPPIC